MDKEEDERREAAIASSRTLQPKFKTKGVAQAQLFKFHELYKRWLELKSKSKFDKKSKGDTHGTSKSHGKALIPKHNDDPDPSITMEDSCVPNLKTKDDHFCSSLQQDNVAASLAPKKRQRLHWGLDKERWERKANM